MLGLNRDKGFYLFTFGDETGDLFKVHANTILEAENKLMTILNLAEDDSRRELHWQNWTPNIPSDAFKYGSFRKMGISPRTEPDPFLRRVQK